MNQGQEEPLKQQIKQLQQEVQYLERNSNKNETDVEMASNNNRGQQQNMEIISMIKLHKTNHEHIKKLWRALKVQLDTNLIH